MTGMRQGYLVEVVKDQCEENRFVAGEEFDVKPNRHMGCTCHGALAFSGLTNSLHCVSNAQYGIRSTDSTGTYY